MSIDVARIDHLVLTVADVDRTCAFYEAVLGMERVTFAGGRVGLAFGDHKINLHVAGREFEPKAAQPTPGSGDFCLVTTTPLPAVAEHLAARGVEVVHGPVDKVGARAALRSIYVRDPDGNLVEISNEAGAS